MNYREKLREILGKPIFPHEKADPLDAVTDYLIDNDVLPVVRCRNCKRFTDWDGQFGLCEIRREKVCVYDYCSNGERKGKNEPD